MSNGLTKEESTTRVQSITTDFDMHFACRETADVLLSREDWMAIRSALTAREQQRDQAVRALLDIAPMNRKAGSESAKNALTNMGINWETGEPAPNYGSMT